MLTRDIVKNHKINENLMLNRQNDRKIIIAIN